MASRLALFCSGALASADQALLKLARMMGVTVTIFEISAGAPPEELLALVRGSGHRVLAAGSAAISTFKRQTTHRPLLLETLFGGFDYAFMYGFAQPHVVSEDVAAWLTDGALGRPNLLDAGRIDYSISKDRMCRQLRGLSFAVDASHDCPVFACGSGATGFSRIIEAQGRPFLVAMKRAGCEVFLLASDRIIHTDAPAETGDPRSELYPALLPALFFLRHAFGEYCWDNPRPRAVLTVDDPPLQPQYGFFSYERLLKEMRRQEFASTIAFIPWNYRRIAPRTVELVRAHADKLSICIHGCDHTGGEFATDDEAMLRCKARIARARVRQLEEASGLACDPIMVFPQGGFSRAALRALKAERYLAAVNTSVFPSDWRAGELTIGDLLDIAVTRYEGFPVFGRRYPRTVVGFALDLYLGKPAVIVEHHGFFRNGYRTICELVDQINALEPRVSWQPLARTLCESALYRRTGQSAAEVKCYTDQVIVSNPYGRRMTFKLSRSAGVTGSVESVLQDGAPLDYRLNGGAVESWMELGPEAESLVTFVNSPSCAESATSFGFGYGARVALRRYLSEFRDNYLARSEGLLSAWEKLARRLLS
jgi:peptidoglycan/xylan/chitin deacetylase (PgdA/CDA1 family)